MPVVMVEPGDWLSAAAERSPPQSHVTVEPMERRSFLRLMGAASIAPGVANASAGKPAGATVLFDDRATALGTVRREPNDAAALWIRKRDLPRVNGFEVKPQGACRADVCI